MEYEIKDINLAPSGLLRIEWAKAQMPVLGLIKARFEEEKPLAGIKIGACLHVTTETANLVETLKAGGAEIYLCASNPLSTQDDVAGALVKEFEIPVFAIKGEDSDTYYKHIRSVLKSQPDITIDDGADLVSTVHSEESHLMKKIIGGTEETTTGIVRLRNMEREGVLGYPIIAVNEANSKHLFDNRYGTGQSTIDGIIRATNILLAGKNFVVCGYGWCGRGVAMRAKGFGANVIITETEPLKALEALMDGYQVMPIKEAAKIGDVFVTVTGNINVIRKEHLTLMKDGALLANSGHFNVEIDIPGLEGVSSKKRKIREYVDEYTLADGRRIYLLADGRLVNLSAAEGHPAAVMDMSFANQALSVEYLVKEGRKLQKRVYPVPEEIDRTVAKLKLESLGVQIDELTQEQREYIASWQLGT